MLPSKLPDSLRAHVVVEDLVAGITAQFTDPVTVHIFFLAGLNLIRVNFPRVVMRFGSVLAAGLGLVPNLSGLVVGMRAWLALLA